LASVEAFVFASLVAFGCLYVAFRRRAVMWSVIATIIFFINTVVAMGIPFKTDSAGNVIGTGMNIVLSGISMLFGFLALMVSVIFAFELMRGSKTYGV